MITTAIAHVLNETVRVYIIREYTGAATRPTAMKTQRVQVLDPQQKEITQTDDQPLQQRHGGNRRPKYATVEDISAFRLLYVGFKCGAGQKAPTQIARML